MYIKEGSILTFYRFLSVIRYSRVLSLPIAGKKVPKEEYLSIGFAKIVTRPHGEDFSRGFSPS